MAEERQVDGDATIIPFPTSPSFQESLESLESAPLTVREAIGEVLREERTDQDRTLADVADDANVSLPYLSEIERGRKDVSSDLLESVTRALELEVADVLERAARRLRATSISGPQLSLAA